MKELEEIVDLENDRGVSKQLGLELGNGRGTIVHDGTFLEITSLENLFLAWQEFKKGKRSKPDVQEFELHLEDNIFRIFEELQSGRPREIIYRQFHIIDPKPRIINKTLVSERLIHQAIYQVLMPLFDKTFVFDSYSCRKKKGTHKAFERLVKIARKQSNNYSGCCWALKCDIRKFFHSVDHLILIELLRTRISDEKLLNLLEEIIESFNYSPEKGMPLGNLTSQLFANVYLDPLDKFIKHKLGVKYYLRYADDFILLSQEKKLLEDYLLKIKSYLMENLKLNIHPDKVLFRKLRWGLDFVGYEAHEKFTLPRGKTVKRMSAKLERVKSENPVKLNESLQSYLGYLKHVDSIQLSERIKRVVEI